MRRLTNASKAETEDSYRQRILRAQLHIQNHLDEEMPLEELARVACFSPYHFHRIFRGIVGEPVKEHVRRLRLERAALRLRFTSQPVTEIAFQAGYETHESFTRAFEAMFGQAPSAFRKSHMAAWSGRQEERRQAMEVACGTPGRTIRSGLRGAGWRPGRVRAGCSGLRRKCSASATTIRR